MNDNGKHILVPHPKYQREYVYSDKKRDAIIETVIEGFQLGLMYWSKGGHTTEDNLQMLCTKCNNLKSNQ